MDTAHVQQENRHLLIKYFESGCKGSRGCGMLGVELEHHILMNSGAPVSYEPVGERVGVREVLEYLRRWYPKETFGVYRDLLGLLGDEGSVTLEPAAQLELSAAPFARVKDVGQAYENFYERVEALLAPRGAHLVSLCYHPTQFSQQLSLIP